MVVSLADRIRDLEPVLVQWAECHRLYHADPAWEGGECGWWYNERASVGFLAAAAWIAGGLALEEYSSGKAADSGNYKGRCDLYLKPSRVAARDYLCEAKHHVIDITGAESGLGELDARLQTAVADTAACTDEVSGKVGLLFVVPRISADIARQHPELVRQWFDNLKSVRTDGHARFLAPNWPLLDGGDGRLYPGTALLVRSV